MKKNYTALSSILLKEHSIILLLFCIVNAFSVSGQIMSQNNYYKTISHGESIEFGVVENGVTWTVSSSDGLIATTFLKDNDINNFIFKNAGTYTITFNDLPSHLNSECNHSSFPKNMVIKVSPVNMKFDFSKVVFSEPIQPGVDCSRITVTVPVLVKLQNATAYITEIPNFRVAGVGSNITATSLNKEIELKEGIQIFSYQLSGNVSSRSYLMFDFTDTNNTVQTYNYTKLVK